MKKLILCFITALVALSASAQPWLFPNRKKIKPDTLKTVATPSDTFPVPPKDSIALTLSDEELEDTFLSEVPEMVKVSLLLPLKSNSASPSRNFMEYYCGALMAVRELGNNGYAIELNVYDTEDRSRPASYSMLEKSDIIIGPVKCEEIAGVLLNCPDKYVISPIEPKAAALTDSLNVIQAPSSWKEQTEEMVAWLKAECGPLDRIVVLKDNSDSDKDGKVGYLLQLLQDSGLDYSQLSSVSGDALGQLPQGTLRFVVASEREVFVCSAINSISTIASRGECPTVLYTTSSVRSLEGINAASLFNANTRMTTSYYVDYEDAEVKQFILDYRALFGNEPSSFAFSGYDTMTFHIEMCRKYGSRWIKRMHREEQWKGLQTDFKYNKSNSAGRINRAIRKVVYSPDFSIKLL